jgi:hypothetical protein
MRRESFSQEKGRKIEIAYCTSPKGNCNRLNLSLFSYLIDEQLGEY